MDTKTLKKRQKQIAVLEVEVLGCSFRTLISVEMQTDRGFEMKLMAVCTTLKNAVLLSLWISIKEQQKLFVQKPEHKPENTILIEPHQQFQCTRDTIERERELNQATSSD